MSALEPGSLQPESLTDPGNVLRFPFPSSNGGKVKLLLVVVVVAAIAWYFWKKRG
jgi:hypothetical protein